MSDENRQKKYTWGNITAACKNIAKQYPGKEPPKVVGISRGGLIPATLIAKYLKASEVYSLGLKSYNDDNDYETREHTPHVYQNILYNCPTLLSPWGAVKSETGIQPP